MKIINLERLIRYAAAIALFLMLAHDMAAMDSGTEGNVRRKECFDFGWKFAFGNASDPSKDYGCGTEYFNYLTKAASIHNSGPYSEKFDDTTWESVDLPHDFVVRLPYSKDASHSHGYKTVGYKYPETSVGWYRKTFHIDPEDKGKTVALLFDGIFRNSRVWVNGFFCGGTESGYLSQYYDITDYLNYGGDNVVCVRADATLEEGWFYEGGGIYRHVWLETTNALHYANDGISITTRMVKEGKALVSVSTEAVNDALKPFSGIVKTKLTVSDAEGKEVAQGEYTTQQRRTINPKSPFKQSYGITVEKPRLWSPETPYLYTLTVEMMKDDEVIDRERVKFGIREVVFDKDRGLLLNGEEVKIKGVNMHQDHAGVGVAIPDNLLEYRIRKLKALGCNAYRASHNPSSQALLDICDSLGMFVIEENRLSGSSDYQTEALRRMIMRARNHPSVILWSVGNEEWGLEWSEKGERVAATMREYCRRFDPSREMTFATSGGPTVEVPVDVAGYNYIMQNPVDEHRKKYPERKCYGSEETSGCGTRGVYYADPEGRWMPALNRIADEKDGTYNRIERGWRFYAERPWAAGCFFWTGFDYRGEPNPLTFPATGSQFGILDYCGFPKDEAYYLKAWWTEEPVLHILPHWNLKGHEGEKVKVWVYSNCDEVELYHNGKTLGRKTMPRYGHIEWETIYMPGSLKAVGYRNGKRMTAEVKTTGEAEKIAMKAHENAHNARKGDVTVVDLMLTDKKGLLVPDACQDIYLTVEGPAEVLGFGNGDPAFRGNEQPIDGETKKVKIPAFNGCAQVIISSTGKDGVVRLSASLAPQKNEEGEHENALSSKKERKNKGVTSIVLSRN